MNLNLPTMNNYVNHNDGVDTTSFVNIEESIKEAVVNSMVDDKSIMVISNMLKSYKLSTFLVMETYKRIIDFITDESKNRISGFQDDLFDLITEIRYNLAVDGVGDNEIEYLVKTSLSAIYNSNVLDKDYIENAAKIPEHHASDSFLNVLFLMRLNVGVIDKALYKRNNMINKDSVNG